MSAPDDDDRRTIADSGSQDAAEGVVPPYEGRKEKAEPTQQGGTSRGGVRVGGATGPVPDDQPKAADPETTPGGRTASPADERPAEDEPQGRPADPGVDLPSHIAGVPKGESGGA